MVIYWIVLGVYTPTLSYNSLSGKVSIVLEKALWRNSNKEITYQDITLDLICENNDCYSEIWGFAPDFNQSEHQGTVIINKSNDQWILDVDLMINRDPWLSWSGKANYKIELTKKNEKVLVGNYQGNFNNKLLQGKVSGIIKPLYPQPLTYHKPIKSQEHPRLLFREEMVPEIRKKATTKIGKQIFNKLEETLNQTIVYDDYVPNAGYHAAGQCFHALIEENPKQANQAWTVVKTAINTSYRRLFELSPMVTGIAIAYDLCYRYWDDNDRISVSNWLAQQAQLLIDGTPDKGWNPTAWSNWNARARGAAGLAALAILKESKGNFSQDIDIEQLLTIAKRNIIHYLETAIGDKGFGTEGDHYTTEPFILTLFPFFTGYYHVKGENFATQNSNLAWLLPNYLMRIIPRDKSYPIPSYGRHRNYPGGSLFAMGMGSVPFNFLPGVMWGFDHYWGENGDQSFGIKNSLDAIFLLVNYRENLLIKHPSTIFDKVLADEKKGFYVFRNQWNNKNDFVASIYGKREYLTKSWSFPDTGSFRIWGLGENWAIAGESKNQPENENIIIQENANKLTMEPIYFQSQKDGSGIVSLQAKNWLRSFAVDYSNISGVPGLFVMVDQFNDSQNDHTWVMNTQGNITIDKNIFMIKRDENVTMKGTFITPDNVNLQYDDNNKRIVAQGKGDFFVIMTVQKNKIPNLKIINNSINSQVLIGNRIITFKDKHISFGIE
ncbi:hypothetical protein [Crocosphaera chwakensis]|uniref:hypothetical protein n=1 Tax=Crocosphaera chwakensis TaxID=2546361 RepID=UPI001E5BED64|nr:hypothetical protein [Crocosphaera chwakensis]